MPSLFLVFGVVSGFLRQSKLRHESLGLSLKESKKKNDESEYYTLLGLDPPWLNNEVEDSSRWICPRKPRFYFAPEGSEGSEVEAGRQLFRDKKAAINKITHKLLTSVRTIVEVLEVKLFNAQMSAEGKLTQEQMVRWFTHEEKCNVAKVSGSVKREAVEAILYSEPNDESVNFREKLGLIECAFYTYGPLKRASSLLNKKLEQKDLQLGNLGLKLETLEELRMHIWGMQKAKERGQTGWAPEYPQEAASSSSWVPLAFDMEFNGGGQLWRGSKTYINPGECAHGKFDISLLDPPLSSRERELQCPEGEPCEKTKWCVGQDYIKMLEGGLFTRYAKHCGFSTPGGPSGHTLQYFTLAKILGFTDEDLVDLRDTMFAWMVPPRDHGFLDIIAVTDPFMPTLYKWPTVKAGVASAHSPAASAADVKSNNELIIFRSLNSMNQLADETLEERNQLNTEEIKKAVDRIFDGQPGEVIDAGTLAVVGNEALVTIASMSPKGQARISWDGAPSFAMKPLLSTLDDGYSAFCEGADNRENEKICYFMEPIMMFDIHSWASSECMKSLKAALENIPSIYKKFQHMETECAGDKRRSNKKRFQKKAYVREKEYGRRFLENFQSAEQLIIDEHKALGKNGQRLLQRYNEVGMRLLPWDIVGVDLGTNVTAAIKLIEYINKRRKELLSIYEPVVANEDSKKAHEYIREKVPKEDKNMKIFYKFLDAQYSGFVTSAAGGEEDIGILNRVPHIWYAVLKKIVERLESPLKKYKYDINEAEGISTLAECDSIDGTLEYQCRNVESKENAEGLFYFPERKVTE